MMERGDINGIQSIYPDSTLRCSRINNPRASADIFHVDRCSPLLEETQTLRSKLFASLSMYPMALAHIGVIITDDDIQNRRYRATFLRIFQHIAAQKGSVRNDTLPRQGRASRGAARSLIALSGNNGCFAWLRSTLIAPSSRQVCLTRRGSFERAHLYRNSRPNVLLVSLSTVSPRLDGRSGNALLIARSFSPRLISYL